MVWDEHTDRQTGRQADGQTGRQTDNLVYHDQNWFACDTNQYLWREW